MSVLFRKLINSHSASLLKRCMHLTSIRPSYEGEGKTTVTLLNNNFDYGLMIDNISQHGFILNNGVRIIGPMVIFPKTTLSWNIAASPDMNEESFSLLLNLEPKLDILVIGLDDDYPYNAPFLLNLKDLFKKHDISTEIVSVFKACSTFNFLNAENRYAAAALIPPRITYTEDVLLQRPNQDPKKIQVADRMDKDPLLYNYKQNEVSSQVLVQKQKEFEESLRVRSPWRKEDKPYNILNDQNTTSPLGKKTKK
ncbi:NADH dehydrogenase [ubiquinone] 1 alpha subcomplex assembly factor 3 [Nasonia vitripennis]|uniref:NADH dehydrogenase [ubiquinone] 1 alpha subcomplex assembly factor 3 n=1 Tax=Nasonia vitripennis TaxID=7425 RepID=A0A7M7H603_NASVI|nr:NADH dehydrogenase [ubiquinone] 1 alpha subcomplex assembly factor 3 [Nasonia vitripennis]